MKQSPATIYASFETVDLAELAARQIKKFFPEVHSIAIRYRNTPPIEHSSSTTHVEPENAAFLTAAAMGNGFGNGFGVAPVFFPYGAAAEVEGSRYENVSASEKSTESHIVIKADPQKVNAIEAKLFNLGGVSVHASLRP